MNEKKDGPIHQLLGELVKGIESLNKLAEELSMRLACVCRAEVKRDFVDEKAATDEGHHSPLGADLASMRYGLISARQTLEGILKSLEI